MVGICTSEDDAKQVDIPDGMDPSDAIVAIKLLYGAEQTYRSVLHDFANYQPPPKMYPCDEEERAKGSREHGIPGTHPRELAASLCRRKRPRRNKNSSDGNEDHCDEERHGRITHLHVTGIACVFLPSFDLCFSDLVKLQHLVCLKLNGCDSVPSEIFFGLPHLKSLSLINCQELNEPAASIASYCKPGKTRRSAIRKLDVRGGGLWGPDFLTALALLLPWLSSSLRSLRLDHTPYASCYTNEYGFHSKHVGELSEPDDVATEEDAITTTTDGVSEGLDRQRLRRQNKAKLVRQTLFHEKMGRLLLDGLRSLAEGVLGGGDDHDDDNEVMPPIVLEELTLSFFCSLPNKDVASLLLDVVPLFPELTLLALPHHTLSNLEAASTTIEDRQKDYQRDPEGVLSSLPLVARSLSYDALSWKPCNDGDSASAGCKNATVASTSIATSSVASVSRLRKLVLKPSSLGKWPNVYNENTGGIYGSRSITTTTATMPRGSDPQTSKQKVHERILFSLLSYFPELAALGRRQNKQHGDRRLWMMLYGSYPCTSTSSTTNNSCCCGNETSHNDERFERARAIAFLLWRNHTGRCLLEGLRDDKSCSESNEAEKKHKQQKHAAGSRRRRRKPPCSLSVWPLVLERAWKTPPPDFFPSPSTPMVVSSRPGGDNSGAAASAETAIFHLLREGPVLFHQRTSHKNATLISNSTTAYLRSSACL